MQRSWVGTKLTKISGGVKHGHYHKAAEKRQKFNMVQKPDIFKITQLLNEVGHPLTWCGAAATSTCCPGNEEIRTLLDRQREQILADCQAEIKRHEIQANYDRRSVQKLSKTIESKQEELHRAQAEELQRRDQQLLHERLLQQNSELREAHHKSLDEMEELKKFQSSTFDTIARRRLVEDRDTILEITGKIQGIAE